MACLTVNEFVNYIWKAERPFFFLTAPPQPPPTFQVDFFYASKHLNCRALVIQGGKDSYQYEYFHSDCPEWLISLVD